MPNIDAGVILISQDGWDHRVKLAVNLLMILDGAFQKNRASLASLGDKRLAC